MTNAVKMGLDTKTYIPSFINIGSGIQKLTERGYSETDTQTTWCSHTPLLFFQNQESRLIKMGWKGKREREEIKVMKSIYNK
jgi:hypothetical protein